jgi:ribonuclease HI
VLLEPSPTTESQQQLVKQTPAWLALPHRFFAVKALWSYAPSVNLGIVLGFVLAFALLILGNALFATFLGLAAMGLHTLGLVMRELVVKARADVNEPIQVAPVTVNQAPLLGTKVMKLVDAVPLLPDNPAFQLLSTNKAFLIYTDASCQDHVPWRPGAWATLTVANGETLERTGAMFCATAQEAEAMIILEAVRVLPKGAGAVVINDCQMVIQALNGATPFLDKNTSRIVKGTKALIAQKRLNVKFIWMTETTPEHQQVHKLAKKTAKANL